MYQRIRKLTTPTQLKRKIPFEMTAEKERFDSALKNIINGKGKFLLIIGPCSADDRDSVLEYCEKLKVIYNKVRDKIFIVPRIYTTKPRSEAGAYRGMLHSPDGLTENFNRGIASARSLMNDIAYNFGFFAADEMLYPELYTYFDDLISYVTIGARSSEDQLHRLSASSLDVPVGIKNPMHGNLNILAKSVKIVSSPNDFALGGYEIRSGGNCYAHAILRGYTDNKGNMFPNFEEKFLEEYAAECEKLRVLPSLIIDCNHFNSGKNPLMEPEIALKAAKLSRSNREIRGLMIESYLYDGKQDFPAKRGVSLTDGCLGIKKTEKLIYEIADII